MTYQLAFPRANDLIERQRQRKTQRHQEMSDVFYNPTSETTCHHSSYILLVTQTTSWYVAGGGEEDRTPTGCENQEARVVMGCHPGDCDHSLKESLLVPNSTQTSVGDKYRFHFLKIQRHAAVNSPGPGNLVSASQRTVFPHVPSHHRPAWKDPRKQIQGSHWVLFRCSVSSFLRGPILELPLPLLLCFLQSLQLFILSFCIFCTCIIPLKAFVD